MMRCCFDKRVWIALAVIAAGLLIADPRAGWVALPVLAGLACPVSMLVMMRSMRRGSRSPAPADGGEQTAGGRGPENERAAEIARLRREVEALKAHAGTVTPVRGAASAAARTGRGGADSPRA